MSVEKIGRYQIIGEVGKGAMGVVYKATDPTIGRTVALKTMRVDIHAEQHDDMLRRFQNEARAAGLLSHPNIVTIYDAGEDQGLFYIAMELIEGESLAAVIAKKRSLPAQEVVEIGNQICAGLQYAHTKKVVHRDIKPANIMLAPGGVVKITDFGIAKAGASLTHTGEVVGTPHYMSPEQIKGRPLDGRTDLFSTGVVLYEMITGEKPFNGSAVTTVIYKIVNENPIPPREVDVTIHPGLSLVITKSLAKDPEERYQDAADLSTALRSYKIISLPESNAVTPAPLSVKSATRSASPAAAAVQPARAPSTIAMKPMAPPKTAPATEVATVAVERSGGSLPLRNVVVAVAIFGALLFGASVLRSKFREHSTAAPASQVADRPAVPIPPASTEQAIAEDRVTHSTPEIVDKADQTGADGQDKGGKYANMTGVGDLRITSNPSGAQVTIDDVRQDWYVTPFNTPPVKAGTHTITANAPGLPPQTRTIEVTPRKKTVVDFQLAGDNTIFNISSVPTGADILIDGQATGGRTPAQFALKSGAHKITLRLEGFDAAEFTAEGAAGAEVNLAPRLHAHNSVDISAAAQADTPGLAQMARMRRAIVNGEMPEGMGAVQIRTRPKGANISIENKPLGRVTPLRVPMRPGSYNITIQKPGFQSVTRVVKVEEGQLLEVDELLLPQR